MSVLRIAGEVEYTVLAAVAVLVVVLVVVAVLVVEVVIVSVVVAAVVDTDVAVAVEVADDKGRFAVAAGAAAFRQPNRKNHLPDLCR